MIKRNLEHKKTYYSSNNRIFVISEVIDNELDYKSNHK